MSLKLMFITNRTDVALIAESAGVDRIFVDMEYIGKSLRQGGMNTVQSNHTVQDVKSIKDVLTSSQCFVRINPIHDASIDFSSTEEEIDGVIKNGADVVMLPYFKTPSEVERFINGVDGRVKTSLLVETPEAVECIDEILSIKGIDEVHIGLNDLSLGYGKKFMFELLCDGTVEKLCETFKSRNIAYGFGGIAALGKGLLPAEKIIAEHYRLGSGCAILSRSFCNVAAVDSVETINSIFQEGVSEIRAFEGFCSNNVDFLENNKNEVRSIICEIAR